MDQPLLHVDIRGLCTTGTCCIETHRPPGCVVPPGYHTIQQTHTELFNSQLKRSSLNLGKQRIFKTNANYDNCLRHIQISLRWVRVLKVGYQNYNFHTFHALLHDEIKYVVAFACRDAAWQKALFLNGIANTLVHSQKKELTKL